ncbi:MAG: hypothetical protein E6I94_10020, partial [Chloroflexi bacterium]
MAPVDRPAERLLARRHVARSSDEQAEPVVEAGEERAHGKDLHPRGRELDREGQAVQAEDDLDDRLGVRVREPERRLRGHRPYDEQAHGLGAERLVRRYHAAGLREAERRDGELLLARHAQGHAARHEDLQVGRLTQEATDGRCCHDDLFEVVEHEEDAAPCREVDHA